MKTFIILVANVIMSLVARKRNSPVDTVMRLIYQQVTFIMTTNLKAQNDFSL